VHFAAAIDLSVKPLTSIGTASRNKPEESSTIRGGFDKETIRRAQAFAVDAVSLWNLNQSLLIVNELELYNAKPTLSEFIWLIQSQYVTI
jgi:hypothetical protein